MRLDLTRRLLFVFLIFYMLLPAMSVCADQHKPIHNLSIELERVNLQDAIRIIAKVMRQNIMISPAVSGQATLHLDQANAIHAFDLLLTAHGLAKWPQENIWYIAPREELLKRKLEELKWQDALSQSEPLLTRTWQIQYGKAADIARIIQDDHASLISKRGHVRVDPRTNIICIQDTTQYIDTAQRLIHQLDVPIKQILIEARLASIDNDFERELGIQFSVQSPSSAEDNDRSDRRTLNPLKNAYSLAIARLADESVLDVKLSALEEAGHAELISSPSLFTADQQPASIEAGDEVPYQQVSESGGTAVVFKKAVLGLKVTPQVLPGNRVVLQLQINQDRPGSRIIQGVPTISTRQITTNVLVRAGRTIVLGGIYENNHENGQKRLPFISQIPLIGELFKQRHRQESKRELLIFITPKIIAQ